MVRGIIRRVEDDRRIGFSLLFAPPDWLGLEARFGTWEYGIVIPDRRDRDGFRAIQASDAMTHYLVDHLGLEDWWWRIRADNRPSRAIARRMGYRSLGVWTTGRHAFAFHRMPRAAWERRRARLERAEAENPSPGGAAFVTLEGPPYIPVRGGSADDEGGAAPSAPTSA
jgi:RimJ/RimL family protein N-acetyltransferase